MTPPDENEFERMLLRDKAVFDQLGESLKQFAPPLKQHYDALIKEGFSPPHAIYLTYGLQKILMTIGQNAQRGPEDEE